jgi:hypothetical protein
VVHIGMCNAEQYDGNEVNMEDDSMGVSDDEGYSTKT